MGDDGFVRLMLEWRGNGAQFRPSSVVRNSERQENKRRFVRL